ncbi:hypothetical protein [Streptomyces polygonati]|uniref:hypothetical protein n=1 Tax=Streptomyces polygonati TaxID=1617087 RepID=UPI0036D9632C
MIAAIGTALVTSIMPEFLDMIPGGNGTKIGITAFGTMMLAGSWLSIYGKTGVGVAVFLKPNPNSAWLDTRLLEYSREARSQHVSSFYVNVDELSPGASTDRVGITQRVIEARLREENPKRSTGISFYLTCGLANSYNLGSQLFNSTQGSQLRVRDFREISVFNIPPSGTAAPLPPLRLLGAPNGPQTLQGNYSLTSLIQITTQQLNGPASADNRHALIIHIASGSPNMVTDAMDAARHGSHARYQVAANDTCETALIFARHVASFPDDSKAYNAVLKEVVQRWSAHLAAHSGANGLPAEGRLFISAPTSLAFALGALIPAAGPTKVIDYL